MEPSTDPVAAESLAQLPAPGRVRGGGRELALPAVVATAALLVLLGGLMLWRRVAGALHSPLPSASLAAAAALFAGLAAGTRLSWRALRTEPTPRGLLGAVALLPLAALLMVGFALGLPGTSAAGMAALWGLFAVEEAWSLRGLFRKPSPRPASSPEAEPAAAIDEPPPTPVTPPTASPPAVAHAAAADDQGVVQQLTRTRDADGAERLSGWLRASFSPGQRSEAVHLAFCPPFERTPRLAVEQSGGPAVRVKTAQLLPYGARLDLKLAATAVEAEQVVLAFTAESQAAAEPDRPG